jgi:hypothetical protein
MSGSIQRVGHQNLWACLDSVMRSIYPSQEREDRILYIRLIVEMG